MSDQTPVLLVQQPNSQKMPGLDDEVHSANPDILRHLTQLLSDMSQDRQDMLSYICKLESNQEVLLSQLKLLRKQYACLVHHDNLRYFASTLDAKHEHPVQPAAELDHGGQADDTDLPFQSITELEGGHAVLKPPPPATLPVPDKNTNIPPIKKDKITPTNKNFKKDQAFISRMTKTLSKLERKYSIPVEKRKTNMFTRKPRTKHIIPKEFSAIFHLLCAPEPEPIIVPDPYPTVDWSDVRFRPALPDPDECPMLSVSKDPDVYQEKDSSWHSGQTYSTFTSKNPFGTLSGYHTLHGVVNVPSTPVQGYVYCPKSRKWMIHATSTTTPGGRCPAARGTIGTRRREGGRRGKQPRNHR